MPDSPANRLAKRIVVAMNTSRASLAPLELAVTLAAQQRARLDALLVEDSNLFSSAELPFAHEIKAESGDIRPFNLPDAQLVGRLQSRRVRRLLADAETRFEVDTAITVVRGRYVKEALLAGHEADVIFMSTEAVISRGAFTSGRTHTTRATASPTPALGDSSIFVYFDAKDDATRALRLAVVLAKSSGHDIIIGLRGQDDELMLLRQHAEQIVRQELTDSDDGKGAGKLEKAPRPHLHYETIVSLDQQQDARSFVQHAASLQALLSQHQCALLVMGRSHYTDRPDYLEVLNCPLLLVT